MRNPTRGEFFCAVRLPNFPALYAAASLDTASLGAPRRHAVAVIVIKPTFGLDTALSPTLLHRHHRRSPTVANPIAPHRCQPRRTIAIAVPDPSPTPSRRAIAIAVPEVGAAPSSRSIAGFHWLMVAAIWKMPGGSFFRGF
jgi:hypothetical protein